MANAGIGFIAQSATKIALGVTSPHLAVPACPNDLYQGGSPHARVLLDANPKGGCRRCVSMDTLVDRQQMENEGVDQTATNKKKSAKPSKPAKHGSLKDRWRRSFKRRQKKTPMVRRCSSIEVLSSSEHDQESKHVLFQLEPECIELKDKAPRISPSATPPMKDRRGTAALSKCHSINDALKVASCDHPLKSDNGAQDSPPGLRAVRRTQSHQPGLVGAHQALEEVLQQDFHARKPKEVLGSL